MADLKQNTAIVLPCGPFLDSDGVPVAGLTISQGDVQIAKEGGYFATKNSATATVEDTLPGWYHVAFNATDTNTEGVFTIAINVDGALAWTEKHNIVPGRLGDIYEDTGTTIPGLIAAVPAATNTVFSGSVTVSSPVAGNLDVYIVQYDDYIASNNKRLTWSNSSGDWGDGDLTSATVKFTVHEHDGTLLQSFTGEVITATGTQVVGVALDRTETALFTQEGNRYKYQLLIDDGSKRETVATGDVIVTLAFSEPP